MFKLYFGGIVSGLTTSLVVGMLVFIIIAVKRRGSIEKWGRLIALFIVTGTAISALSATRDAFAAPGALFALDSIQSLACSAAGGAIFLIGIACIFLKKQDIRRACFFIASALLIAQVTVVESSRIAGIM